MKKTLTINISGIVFHIEEDAYEILNRYLTEIKNAFGATMDAEEILADIEARISELLKERTSDYKQVILVSDVEEIQKIMGRSEDFGSDNSAQDGQYEHKTDKIKRRLYRNPDDKIIGGVGGGLAAYFDIDAVWVRIILFLLIFLGGISVWVYIILWIVMPLAKTTSEKLAMRGEAANITGIFKSVKEEAGEIRNKYKAKEYGETVRSNFTGAFNALINIAARLAGLFLLFAGIVLMIVFVTSLMGISLVASDNELSNWKSVIFGSASYYSLGILGYILVFGIPMLMLIYTGAKLLFRLSYSNRWIILTMGIAWIAGLFIAVFVAIVTLRDYREVAKSKETIVLETTSDTLFIKMNPVSETLDRLQPENSDELETALNLRGNNYHFGVSGNYLSILGFPVLDVVENNSNRVDLVINKSARGRTKKEASENTQNISYHYNLSSKTLYFDEIFNVEKGYKFRAQKLELKLKVPEGMLIYFDYGMSDFLNDVDNSSNVWSGKMTGRYWKMTGGRLQCIDCEGLDEEETISEDSNKQQRSKYKNSKVKINKNGIQVRTEDKEVNISKDGIHIQEKRKR
jgi:phage shock protein PspC (stress-responsive transcriptional regulator)